MSQWTGSCRGEGRGIAKGTHFFQTTYRSVSRDCDFVDSSVSQSSQTGSIVKCSFYFCLNGSNYIIVVHPAIWYGAVLKVVLNQEFWCIRWSAWIPWLSFSSSEEEPFKLDYVPQCWRKHFHAECFLHQAAAERDLLFESQKRARREIRAYRTWSASIGSSFSLDSHTLCWIRFDHHQLESAMSASTMQCVWWAMLESCTSAIFFRRTTSSLCCIPPYSQWPPTDLLRWTARMLRSGLVMDV